MLCPYFRGPSRLHAIRRETVATAVLSWNPGRGTGACPLVLYCPVRLERRTLLAPLHPRIYKISEDRTMWIQSLRAFAPTALFMCSVWLAHCISLYCINEGGIVVGRPVADFPPWRREFEPGQFMWDLWWTKWHWGGFSKRTSAPLSYSHSSNSSILIYHPGLVK
jgi:hypothetical protein